MKKAKSKNTNNGRGAIIAVKGTLPRQREVYFGRPLSYKADIGPIITIDLNQSRQTALFTAGSVAYTTDIANPVTGMPSFTSRWGSVFREYRVIGCRWEAVLTTSAAGQGEIWFWMDEKSNATPTSTEATTAPHAVLTTASAFGANGVANMARGNWVADDLADLNFQSTATGFSPVYLKAFASNALTGTGASTTGTISIAISMRVQFRDPL